MEDFQPGDLVMLTDDYSGVGVDLDSRAWQNWAKEAGITNDEILVVRDVTSTGSLCIEGKSFYQNSNNFTKVGSL